jgi:hypothetical protein
MTNKFMTAYQICNLDTLVINNLKKYVCINHLNFNILYYRLRLENHGYRTCH